MTNYKDVRYARSGASVTTIPTSAFSSGTFANARIAASNITQHITAFDDAKLKSDVQVLALNQANDENKVAYNLPNTFVDIFQDSSGIGTETTGERNASEYWSSGISETLGYGDNLSIAVTNVIHAYGDNASTLLFDNDLTPSTYSTYYSNTDDTASPPRYGWTQFDMTLPVTLTRAEFYKRYSGTTSMGSVPKWAQLHKSDDNSSWTTLTPSSAVNGSINGNVLTTVDDEDWSGFNISATTARYWRFQMGNGWDHGNANMSISEVRFVGASYINPSATLISNAQTANAATTKVSGVILYQNTAGTATLNTDINIYFSADNGSNWTQSTMTAAGTFSTGVLMAKAPEVTCTSGTQVKYKVTFANQAVAKETRLQGVGMSY